MIASMAKKKTVMSWKFSPLADPVVSACFKSVEDAGLFGSKPRQQRRES
jgi:hypothetical protein